MNTKKDTIAFIIAIREEFDVFLREFEGNWKNSQNHNSYMEAQFQIEDSDELLVIAGCIEEMSSLAAFEFTNDTIKHFSPKIIFNIGIAGCLDDDLHLGNVVLADSCEDYQYQGKLKGSDFKHGGKSYSTSHNSKKTYQSIINNEGSTNGLANNGIPFSLGKIVTVPIVMASSEKKSEILKHHRKAKALDMESCGIARAVKNYSHSEQDTDLYVIKGISDFSDEKKTELDESLICNFREIAMVNAVRYTKKILDHIGYGEINKANHKKNKETICHFSGVVSDLHIKAFRYGDKTKVEAARNIVNAFLDSKSFESIMSTIENKNFEGSQMAFYGPVGSGISVLLDAIYIYLDEKGVECTAIDLCDYSMVYGGQEQSNKRSGNFLEIQLQDLPHGNVVLVDGINFKSPIKRAIAVKIWKLISKKKIKAIFGVYEKANDLDTKWLNEEISVSPISDSSEKINLIKNYSLLANADISNSKVDVEDEVSSYISKFKLENLDQFILDLLINEVKNPHGIGSLSDLISRHVANTIDSSKTDPFEKLNDEFLKNVSKQVFYNLINQEIFESNNPKEHRKTSFEDAYKHKIEFLTDELVNSHLLVRQYLTANHIINIFSEWGNEEGCQNNPELILPYVYPHYINGMCKEIMEPSLSLQITIVSGINNILNSNVDEYMKAHGCYLLGRITEDQPKKEAITLLQRIVNDPKFIESENNKDLMIVRSSYISLSCLGICEANKSYVNRLIDNNKWDRFNRGFHLEYYGDRKYDPKSPLESKDDLQQCPITFDKLLNKLIGSKNLSQHIIEYHTVLSLSFHRHRKGNLDHDIEMKVLKLIEKAINEDMILPRLLTYSKIVHKQLKFGVFRGDQIFLDTIALKFQKRMGWVQRGLLYGESVADHTFGARAVARHFLPSKVKGEGYSKNEVIDMLEIHDLAEGKIGDYTPFDKLDNEKKKKEMYFMWELDVLGGFSWDSDDLNELSEQPCYIEQSKLLRQFLEQSTFNARVARDIDMIENYLQIRIYQEMGFEIERAEIWIDSLKKDLSTTGKRVLKKILKIEPLISTYMLENLKRNQPIVQEHWEILSKEKTLRHIIEDEN